MKISNDKNVPDNLVIKSLICFTILLCSFSVSFAAPKGIIAYPVPYIPSRGSLTISDTESRYASTSVTIDIEIYDITGDKIFKKRYTSFPVRWKGYSSSGQRVSSGLYILKVSVEDLASGSITKNIIRFLVKK
ncbi:MAG: hypothetical protein PF637_03495 [Spirochaetes bacterium]|jgi:hypothetical protein|nr:hypothetical protein [Spirochaetota bacterium]